MTVSELFVVEAPEEMLVNVSPDENLYVSTSSELWQVDTEDQQYSLELSSDEFTLEVGNQSEELYTQQASELLVVGVGPAGADAPTYPLDFEATNKSGGVLQQGSPVATHSSGTGIVGANATNDTLPAVGLLTEGSNSLESSSVRTSGLLTMADWSSVTGSVQLTAKGRYYLSTTTGLLTSSPPSASGSIVQLVGVAVSETTMDIQVWDYVTL